MNTEYRRERPHWAASSKSECSYGVITPVAIREGVCDSTGGEEVLAGARALLLAHAVGKGLSQLVRSIGGKITRVQAVRRALGVTIARATDRRRENP